MNKLKPLSLRETTLKEEMKSRCLQKGQYIDENAKEKFNMLCHLEDFEIQYFELLKQVEKLTGENNDLDERVIQQCNEIKSLKEEKNKQRRYYQNRLMKYQDRIDKINDYIIKHSNNCVEYLDVWEVKELLDMLKEVE